MSAPHTLHCMEHGSFTLHYNGWLLLLFTLPLGLVSALSSLHKRKALSVCWDCRMSASEDQATFDEGRKHITLLLSFLNFSTFVLITAVINKFL